VLALSLLSDGLAVALDTPALAADAGVPAAGGAAPAAADAATSRPPRSLLQAAAGGTKATAATAATPAPTAAPPDPEALLELRDVTIRFPSAHGGRPVVTGLSLDVSPGESVGLIGESGSGKSLTSLAVLGLLPPEAQVTGSIRFRGRELTTLPAAQRRQLCGAELAMVYQDPLAALNPGMRIRAQLGQVCRRSGLHTPAELLEMVRLSPPDTLPAYPHQLSGGQRQRIVLAMALAGDPVLLLADEPTTALDVTLQAEISDLLTELITARGLAMLLVSHDLPLVAELTSRINVMYAGEIVETGPAQEILRTPGHRYTAMLTAAVRDLEERRQVPATPVADAPTPRPTASADASRTA
jgi:peptide/nickel transport system permease protein